MHTQTPEKGADDAPESTAGTAAKGTSDTPQGPREIGGRDGPEPTRYGDWEKNGRCIDF